MPKSATRRELRAQPCRPGVSCAPGGPDGWRQGDGLPLLRDRGRLARGERGDGARVFRVGHRLAGAVRASSVRADGVNLFLADGEAAGQEVFHVHLHVLPRHPDDGFRLEVSTSEPTRAQLDAVAAEIAGPR